uniref:FHA domain-containing protein n=1 Tax=Eubacterium plexicaudatum ASF492 TaxID=1235802 RepID=N2AIP7_9FIRM
MKTNQIAGRCVLACVFVYLLIQIYYLSNYILPSATKEPWRDFVCLFLIQSVFFAACIFAVFIFLLLQRMKRDHASPFEALLLVNAEGKIKREVLLQDKQSFLVTGAKNGKDVFIESIRDPDSDRYLYGVCNLVGGLWYFETMSDTRPIGLKRGDENVIYRLKEGMLYQLSATDVIYADTCKIVIREQKNIWREQNGSDSL